MHHFTDDTNFLLTENSLKKLNKHIKRDLKFVIQWIRANKRNLEIQEKQRLLFSNQEIGRLQNTLIFE